MPLMDPSKKPVRVEVEHQHQHDVDIGEIERKLKQDTQQVVEHALTTGEDVVEREEHKIEEGLHYLNRPAGEDPFQVFLEEHERPLNLPVWRKWVIVVVICTAALCVASASSMVRLLFSFPPLPFPSFSYGLFFVVPEILSRYSEPPLSSSPSTGKLH